MLLNPDIESWTPLLEAQPPQNTKITKSPKRDSATPQPQKKGAVTYKNLIKNK